MFYFWFNLERENQKSTAPHHLVLVLTRNTSFPTLYTFHCCFVFLIIIISIHSFSLYNHIPCHSFLHHTVWQIILNINIMKVHQFTRGFWEHEPSLTLGCKRLRPLAPKISSNNTDNSTTNTPSLSFDLKSFIRPETAPRISLSSSDDNKKDPPSPQSQVHILTST